MYKYFTLLFITIFITQITKAQLFGLPINHFEKGFYYDLNNKKISGKIAVRTGNHILFKPDSLPAGKKKVMLKMINSFVVGVDSFTVNHDNSPQFYKVVFDDSNIKIFSVTDVETYSAPMITTGNGMMMGGSSGTIWKTTKYYYGPDPDHVSPLVRRNFIEIMSQAMANQPIIQQQLKDKVYNIHDMKDLISYYKTVKIRQQEANKPTN